MNINLLHTTLADAFIKRDSTSAFVVKIQPQKRIIRVEK